MSPIAKPKLTRQRLAGPSDLALLKRARRVGRALVVRGWRVATAESCTAGWVAKALTDVPGSSRWVEGGYVVYSNAAKMRDLRVSMATLRRHGAVSEATVLAMARGALQATGADLAIAVSGIAGPDGGTRGQAGRHGLVRHGGPTRPQGITGDVAAFPGRSGVDPAPVRGGRAAVDSGARAGMKAAPG